MLTGHPKMICFEPFPSHQSSFCFITGKMHSLVMSEAFTWNTIEVYTDDDLVLFLICWCNFCYFIIAQQNGILQNLMGTKSKRLCKILLTIIKDTLPQCQGAFEQKFYALF